MLNSFLGNGVTAVLQNIRGLGRCSLFHNKEAGGKNGSKMCLIIHGGPIYLYNLKLVNYLKDACFYSNNLQMVFNFVNSQFTFNHSI